MPMPNPGDKETRVDFLSRCMGNTVMVNDYKDNKQRYAVCNSIWKRRNQKKGGDESGKTEEGRKESQETSKEGVENV